MYRGKIRESNKRTIKKTRNEAEERMVPKVVTAKYCYGAERYSGRLVSVGVDVKRLRLDSESRGLLPSPPFFNLTTIRFLFSRNPFHFLVRTLGLPQFLSLPLPRPGVPYSVLLPFFIFFFFLLSFLQFLRSYLPSTLLFFLLRRVSVLLPVCVSYLLATLPTISRA